MSDGAETIKDYVTRFNEGHEVCGEAIDRAISANTRPTDDRVSKLVEAVAEYLHWRGVNPHIKGGENYLKRFKQALEAL